MFTSIEFRQIYSRCPDKLSDLLRELNISAPHWSENEEQATVAQLDNNITDKLIKLMDSESVIDGYFNLLDISGIDYELSETDNALLKKIIENQTEISDKIKNYSLQSNKEPPKTDKYELDISASKCKLYLKRANKIINHLPGSYGVETKDEKLSQGIRDFIANYYKKIDKSVESIDVYIKLNDNPPRMKRIISDTSAKEETKTLPKDIDKVLGVLSKLNDIIRAIEK